MPQKKPCKKNQFPRKFKSSLARFEQNVYLDNLIVFRVPKPLKTQTVADNHVRDVLCRFTNLKHKNLSDLLASSERKNAFWIDVQIFNRLLFRNHHALFKSKEFRQLKHVQRLLKRLKMLGLPSTIAAFVNSFYGNSFKNSKGAIDTLPSLDAFVEFGTVATAAVALLDRLCQVIQIAYIIQKKQMQQTLFMSQSVLFMASLCRIYLIASKWKSEIALFLNDHYWRLGDCVYGSARTVNGSETAKNTKFTEPTTFKVKKAFWKRYSELCRGFNNNCTRDFGSGTLATVVEREQRPLKRKPNKQLVRAAEKKAKDMDIDEIFSKFV